MSDEATHKIWQMWDASIGDDIDRWSLSHLEEVSAALMEALQETNKQGFEAGYHARDAEVAELRGKADTLGVALKELSRANDRIYQLETKVAELQKQEER